MGWKYTVRGWNYEEGYIYYYGSNNLFVAWYLYYFKIPERATIRYFEGR